MKFILSAVEKTCKKKILYRRFPILLWLPKYSKEDAIADLISGFTVGLMMVPQGLAMASIAGLPPQYGLYGAFAGSFVYIFFGSNKDISVGPSVITSLLTYQCTHGKDPAFVILLGFLTGIIQFLMGICNLGFLVNYISKPVLSGLISAMAFIMIAFQARDLFGIKLTGTTFIQVFYSILLNVSNINIWDAALGLTSISILLSLKMMSVSITDEEKLNERDGKNSSKKMSSTFLMVLFNSRNSLVVIFCSILSFCTLKYYERSPLTLVGEVPSGLPTVKPPSFSLKDPDTNQTLTFTEIVHSYGSGIVVVPLISLLEDILTCKAFANGNSVDATQEMMAIGLSNIVNSFFQGIPGSGAMARSAVNKRSGARTQLASLYPGLMVIFALLFLTSSFYYIPKCSLAAIIIVAIVFMVDIKAIKPMWKTNRSDFWISLITFVACLVAPLAIGLLIGGVAHFFLILYFTSKPKIQEEIKTSPKGTRYLLIKPDRLLLFPSAEFIRKFLTKKSMCHAIPVIIDFSHIYETDYTLICTINNMINNFSKRKQKLFFVNIPPKILEIFQQSFNNKFVTLNSENDIDEHCV